MALKWAADETGIIEYIANEGATEKDINDAGAGMDDGSGAADDGAGIGAAEYGAGTGAADESTEGTSEYDGAWMKNFYQYWYRQGVPSFTYCDSFRACNR